MATKITTGGGIPAGTRKAHDPGKPSSAEGGYPAVRTIPRFLAGAVAPLALALLLTAGEARAQAPGPARNILLVIADDFGVDAARFYPTTADRRATTPPAPPTPNLAALARKGVLFRRAWTTPWCSPTRAALLTGRHSFRTGVGVPISTPTTPGVAEDPELPLGEFSLPEAFQAAKPGQYLLAHIGKWHVSIGEDDPNLQGWPYFAGPRPDLARIDDHYRWPKTVNGVTTTSTTYSTTDQVNDAVRKIGEAKAQAKPYFIWLAFSAPHSPYQKPPNNLHSKDSLPPTGASRRAYYDAMVEAMDTEIGRLLRSVDLATTTVIFVGDNGTPAEVTAKPYNPRHAKGTPYEGGVRVPLLAAGAGVQVPGRVVERIVNGVDLYPTILELAGIDPAAAVPSGTQVDGVSIVPYLGNQVGTPLRSFIYAEEFPTEFDRLFERAIANCCYKLIEREVGAREFYDLKADPYETRNLLGRTLTAAQRSNLGTLDGRLDALIATAPSP